MPNNTTGDAPTKRALPLVLWIILAVALWAIFAISQAPAQWAAWAMTRSGDLALSGVSGTVWNGRASLASVRVDQESFSLGELRWQLEPWSLLVLRPCARLQTQMDRQQLRTRACASLGGTLTLTDTEASAPATVIERLVPDPVDGTLSARFERIQLNDQGLRQLKGSGSWQNARAHNGARWLDIGSYAAELRDDGEGNVIADIFHLTGVLGLDIQATIYAQGGAYLKGTMTLTQAFGEEIQAREWIDLFAQYQGVDENGRMLYELDMGL